MMFHRPHQDGGGGKGGESSRPWRQVTKQQGRAERREGVGRGKYVEVGRSPEDVSGKKDALTEQGVGQRRECQLST